MRSNEEQTRLILEKYEEQKKENRKKVKIISTCVSLAACFAVIFTVGALTKNNPDVSFQNNNNFPVGVNQQQTPATDKYVFQNPPPGIYIPEIIIEPVDEYAAADMLAMVVYNTRVYVSHYVWEYAMPYEDYGHLLGEYVGTGNNNIHCWSGEEDYQSQFASNTPWPFYTVTGYDSAFRLAAVADIDNDRYIVFFDCLNGIWLNKGADLYENLLHMTNNFTAVSYQLHDDWDYGRGNYKPLDTVSADDIKTFISTLNESNFVDLGDIETARTIYDGKQAHLFFHMNDGTTVGLRLYEGGYVAYTGASIGYVCVCR